VTHLEVGNLLTINKSLKVGKHSAVVQLSATPVRGPDSYTVRVVILAPEMSLASGPAVVFRTWTLPRPIRSRMWNLPHGTEMTREVGRFGGEGGGYNNS
jgi:hypothetical protein